MSQAAGSLREHAWGKEETSLSFLLTGDYECSQQESVEGGDQGKNDLLQDDYQAVFSQSVFCQGAEIRRSSHFLPQVVRNVS